MQGVYGNYKKDDADFKIFQKSLWTTLLEFVPETNMKPQVNFLNIIRPPCQEILVKEKQRNCKEGPA